MKGKVYLVGAGPGNSDLITVRGLEILRQAEVIIYDYLIDKELLHEAKPGTELICGDELDNYKYEDGFILRQEKIDKLLVKKAKEGKKVICLKNGDPSIFGRLSQELEVLLKNNIEFEIVPGVTAGTVAACLSGVPLTDRRWASSVVFVTGHEAKDKNSINWRSITNAGTIVLYMGVGNISEIAEKLISAGKSKNTPVIAVSRAGQINQQTVGGKLENIAVLVKEENLVPPAIFIIGEVAKLEKESNWLRKNKRIIFAGLSKKRYFLKGTYFHLPLISILPLDDYREFDRHLKNIRYFDWIVFVSRYGVEYFFRRLKVIGGDSRILAGIKIAAIGVSTKTRLLDFGVLADLVPKNESSEGLISEFKKIDIKGKRIFLPRSDISDKGISRGFGKLGATVVTSFAYRNVTSKNLPDLDLSNFDEIMFTSPSGVRNFKRRYKKVPKNVKIRYIGQITKTFLQKCGLMSKEN